MDWPAVAELIAASYPVFRDILIQLKSTGKELDKDVVQLLLLAKIAENTEGTKQQITQLNDELLRQKGEMKMAVKTLLSGQQNIKETLAILKTRTESLSEKA
jgi:hypothetical protein